MAQSTFNSKLPVKLTSGKPIERILEQGRDLRHASLGAVALLARAKDELTRDGSSVLSRLISEGEKSRRRTSRSTRRTHLLRLDRWTQTLNEGLDRLEQSVESTLEERVARIMKRLDVPTSDDINKLSARVRHLSEQVESMQH